MSERRRTRDCQPGEAKGRLRKAQEWREQVGTVRGLAEREDQVASTIVSLCVLAGIAAADCLCCVELGKHARGDDHAQALKLLATVPHTGQRHALDLGVLLEMKGETQYGPDPPSAPKVVRARRAAERLVSAAEEALSKRG